MENWLFAPSDPSRLAKSSHMKLSLPHVSGTKAVIKTKLSFALLKSASSNIYFHGMGFLTVFILILCAVKKEWFGREGKRFLLFEILHSPLAPFRVPRSACVWFSFVSSRYQHPLRKIFSRELFFLDNLGILLYLNYNSRHLWTIYMKSPIAVNAPFLSSCLPAPSGRGSVTSRLVLKMYRPKGGWWQTTAFVFIDINNGWMQHYCFGLLHHCR